MSSAAFIAILIFIAGAVFRGPLLSLLKWASIALCVVLAWRVIVWLDLAPALNGPIYGVLFGLGIVGVIAFGLGWQARARKTKAEEEERAEQKYEREKSAWG